MIPAALITVEGNPSFFVVSLKTSVICFSLFTLHNIPRMQVEVALLTPVVVIADCSSLTALSMLFMLVENIATLKPSSRNCKAMAFPMPLVPPNTATIFDIIGINVRSVITTSMQAGYVLSWL